MTQHGVGFQELSQRELEIVELLCFGYSNKQIGEHLDIHLKTVESHLSHIRDKIGARPQELDGTRLFRPKLDVVTWAIASNIVPPESMIGMALKIRDHQVLSRHANRVSAKARELAGAGWLWTEKRGQEMLVAYPCLQYCVDKPHRSREDAELHFYEVATSSDSCRTVSLDQSFKCDVEGCSNITSVSLEAGLHLGYSAKLCLSHRSSTYLQRIWPPTSPLWRLY